MSRKIDCSSARTQGPPTARARCPSAGIAARFKRGALLAPLLALGVSACAGLSASPKSPLANQSAMLERLETIYSPDEVANCIVTPVPGQGPCRDRIVQALIAVIDIRFDEYELGFFDANRYGSFGATLATLGLTGAASVAGGAEARILAAIAGGVTGSRESFSREVLVDKTAIALQSAMNARRDNILVQIREGLRKSAENYPLGAALSDVNAYYRAGTIVGALAGVNEAASADARVSRANLGTISPAAATPTALDLQRRFRATPAANRPAFMKRIETIMAGLGMPGTAEDLMRSPGREADRAIVARQLSR